MKTERPITEFVAEAEDILESVSGTLISLESGLASGVDPDLVNGLFRSVHSFKGLAGIFGLKEPSDLAHRMESLLDEVRLGRVAVTREVLDLLFETLDLLARLVQQSGAGQRFDDITACVEKMDAVISRGSAVPSDRSLLARVNLEKEILQALTEYEEHRLIENIRLQRNLFKVRASFKLSDFEKEIKKLNKLLKQRGEIICTLPAAGSGSGIDFTIVLGTADTEDALARTFKSPNVSIEPVGYVEAQAGSARAQAETAVRSVSNTVRVDISKLDSLMNIVGELHLARNALSRIAKDIRAAQGPGGFAADLSKVHRGLERKLNDLQDGILDVRMVPIGQIFTRLAQVVRKYAREAGKEIDLQLLGEETELDKLMIEDLADPLMHLIRNAIDHGIEPVEERKGHGKPEKGVLRLTAYPKGNHVVITIEDDGRGMDPDKILAKAVEKGVIKPDHGLDPGLDRKEILDLIFIPGFSTSEQVTEISGRGVGMDVVKKNISKLSGMIDIETEAGIGTRFILTLPITLAIIKAVVVEAGGQVFAAPLSSVLEIIRTRPRDVQTIEAREVIVIRGDTVPLVRLSKVFGLSEGGDNRLLYVMLVGLAERRLGIVVDRVKDQQEIVIKPLGKRLSETRGIAGATELGVGDRRVVLVLDVESLIEGAFKKVRKDEEKAGAS
mgnify:CR=1 FL=1